MSGIKEEVVVKEVVEVVIMVMVMVVEMMEVGGWK